MVNCPPEKSEPEKKKHSGSRPTTSVERAGGHHVPPGIHYICYYCGWVRATSIAQHEHTLDHRLKASGLKKCGLLRVGRMIWNPDHYRHDRRNDQVRAQFEREFSVHGTFIERRNNNQSTAQSTNRSANQSSTNQPSTNRHG